MNFERTSLPTFEQCNFGLEFLEILRHICSGFLDWDVWEFLHTSQWDTLKHAPVGGLSDFKEL